MLDSTSISTSQNDPDSSPIFKFDNDILWYIFSLNIDMEQETEMELPALVTLRSTSQVCSGWRALAVGSPSLWAHALNFNSLPQKVEGEHWGKEIIRRSGTAPLHVKATNIAFGVEFFEQVLREQWTRIQSLDIRHDSLWGTVQWGSLFNRPAPCLETFKFDLHGPDGVFGPDFILFANKGPLLRTLSAKGLNLDLASFPSQNLRDLTLHSSILAVDLLCALRRMPLLERFELAFHTCIIGDASTQASLPRITLPRLMILNFFLGEGVDITLSLLSHIVPADGCTLDFFGAYGEEFPDHNSVELQRDVLSKYSQYCTDLARATKLSTTLSEDRFTFSVSLPSHHRFFFGMSTEPGVKLPEHTMSALLSSFATIQLNKIKTLTLYIGNDSLISNPDLISFILALDSVEELKTDTQTLDFLRLIQTSSAVVIFPTVKDILLDSIDESDNLRLVAGFLSSRMGLGMRAGSLTLTMGPLVTVECASLLTMFPGLNLQMTPKPVVQTGFSCSWK